MSAKRTPVIKVSTRGVPPAAGLEAIARLLREREVKAAGAEKKAAAAG